VRVAFNSSRGAHTVAKWIAIIDWGIPTIGKHVVAQQTLSGGDEGIGIDKSADFGVVISALEIVQSGLCGAGLATPARSYITHTPQRGISCGDYRTVLRRILLVNRMCNP
jgi:hypothetical protein